MTRRMPQKRGRDQVAVRGATEVGRIVEGSSEGDGAGFAPIGGSLERPKGR
jgi:hypothetical protein